MDKTRARGTCRPSPERCLMDNCIRRNQEACQLCGFWDAEHDRRVDAIHRQGLRSDPETGLLYLPVKRREEQQ